MKKLLSIALLLVSMIVIQSCSIDSDGCVTCTDGTEVITYCEADGDYNGLSESDFVEFQFIAGWTCN